MAQHKLRRGRAVIENIAALGQALGYVSKLELPVAESRGTSPAVDVAWLREEGQRFPLMIFEVETRVTNSVANNAVKIYGQPNERFEKPLFFFHVFLTGGDRTTRVDSLRQVFGTHNYRTYTLDESNTSRLICDILAQHRRLERMIDVPKLVPALERGGWEEFDLDKVLRHLEDLGFEGNFLPVYAKLSSDQRKYLPHFLRLARLDILARPKTRAWRYATYFGDLWSEPIHIGVLSVHEPKEANYLEALRWWQEESTYQTMIGPHLGLSRDYDDFLLGTAPALLALLASLFYKVSGANQYILQQYRIILSRLAHLPASVSLFTAVWALHVAAAAGAADDYIWLKRFIEDRGGISPMVLYDPPGGVSFVDFPDEQWLATYHKDASQVPELGEFEREVRTRNRVPSDPDQELTQLALELLTGDSAMYEWSKSIIRLLHSGERQLAA